MNLGKAIAESDVGQDLRDLTMLVSEEMKLQMFSGKPAVCQNGWRVQKGMEMSYYFCN